MLFRIVWSNSFSSYALSWRTPFYKWHLIPFGLKDHSDSELCCPHKRHHMSSTNHEHRLTNDVFPKVNRLTTSQIYQSGLRPYEPMDILKSQYENQTWELIKHTRLKKKKQQLPPTCSVATWCAHQGTCWQRTPNCPRYSARLHTTTAKFILNCLPFVHHLMVHWDPAHPFVSTASTITLFTWAAQLDLRHDLALTHPVDL